jgi:integrase
VIEELLCRQIARLLAISRRISPKSSSMGDIPPPLRRIPTRDRVLSDDEIVAFWRGCQSIGWPFGSVFKLLLLTGQRLYEVAGMTWGELDLDNRVWQLPAERVKNGRQHEVALSDLAMEILRGLPPIDDSVFVFPSTDPTKPVSGFNLRQTARRRGAVPVHGHAG